MCHLVQRVPAGRNRSQEGKEYSLSASGKASKSLGRKDRMCCTKCLLDTDILEGKD